MPSIPQPPPPSPAAGSSSQAPPGPAGWGAVIALKRPAVAKSRLGGLPVPLRQRLAEAMAWDTLGAVQRVVQRLVVVSDDPNLPGRLVRLGIAAEVLPEPMSAGMNAALITGDRALRERGCDRVLACVGDLPALTGAALETLLRKVVCRDQPGQLYVPDHTGKGTTMLIADRVPLDPRFQGESAAAHRLAGAVPVVDLGFPELHHDVDSPEDLAFVVRLGVGPNTAGLIDPLTKQPAAYQAITVAEPDPRTDDLAVITDAGVRLRLPVGALDPQLRMVRPGQRLHAVTVDDRILTAWL